MALEQVTDAEYAQIAAAKPSTARNHIFEVTTHIKNGHLQYLSDPRIPCGYIGDGGSLLCRGKASIHVSCHSYQIDQHIPKEFTENGVKHFSCVYRSSISNIVKDSDTAVECLALFIHEIKSNNIHATEVYIADGKATEHAVVKLLRRPQNDEFRAEYHISKLMQYISDYLHNVYNAYNNAAKAVTSQ